MRSCSFLALSLLLLCALVHHASAAKGGGGCSPESPQLCNGLVHAVYSGPYCDSAFAVQYNPAVAYTLGTCWAGRSYPTLYTKAVIENGNVLATYQYTSPAGSTNGCAGIPISVNKETMNLCVAEEGWAGNYLMSMLIANASEPVRQVMPIPPAKSEPRITTHSIQGCFAPGKCGGAPYTTYFSDTTCTTPFNSEWLVGGINSPPVPAKLNQCYLISQEHYMPRNLKYTCADNSFTVHEYSSGCDSDVPLNTYSVPTGICIPDPYREGYATMNYCN